MERKQRRASWGRPEAIPRPEEGWAAWWFFGFVTVFLAGFVILGAWNAVALQERLGIVGPQEATVADVEYHPGEDGCRTWRYVLEWETGGRWVHACRPWNPGLEVGNVVTVVSAGQTVRPTPTTTGDLVGELVVVGGFAVPAWWLGWRCGWGLWLRRGRGQGVRMPGRIIKAKGNKLNQGTGHVAVELDAGPRASGGVHRWYGEPAMLRTRMYPGDHLTVWGARRGWFTGKPKGPWVIQRHGDPPRIALLGWIWRRRPKELIEDHRVIYGTDR